MPELPEVETIRRGLIPLVVGKTIKSVEVLCNRIIRTPDEPALFIMELAGETIHDIGRKGKHLLFELDHWTLVSHLRMEGKYSVVKQGEPYDKHTHVMFHFTDGTDLRYHDVRKFGTMDLIPKGHYNLVNAIAEMGPEPIDPAFTVQQLKERIKGRKTAIKVVLLNQQVVSGLGNIYVDEALALSHIHPLRTVDSLKKKEIDKLFDAMRSVLQKGIDLGGATIRTYVNSLGKQGLMQEDLYVYGMTGEPCKFCSTLIEKIVVGGRGTHYCPKCQKV